MIEKYEIYECLIDMCVQYLADTEEIDGYLSHDCMSAGENALDLLYRLGLAETEDNYNYKILWKNLDKLKKESI